ncbi:MAG: hypothetical protein HOC74_30235 [Gemmatimonadetes bacterium]|nr:hypothetical protein [Gemmatimonadota bacterium]
MADLKEQLARLRAHILAQNGTVLRSVEGVVELDDKDKTGKPRLGPVLVLRSIEEGAQLKLAHPRLVTVLGSLSGQVFGAYRVKTGNLLSGRLEGVRHVEIIHNMGSKGNSNVDSWIVFEATSDPGFFNQLQQGLERLRLLERHQQPQRDATALQILMRALKDVPYDIRISIPRNQTQIPVFSLLPDRGSRRVKMNLKRLLGYVVDRAEKRHKSEGKGDLLECFKAVLQETVTESLRLANSGGIGASLRKQRGDDAFGPQVEILCDYLQPKLLSLWLKLSENFVQRMADRLSAAPMVLKVGGQLAPFFQIEYPRWKFHITGGEIVPEKVADCNIACQLGSVETKMKMTYNYVGGEDWISQTLEIELDETKGCQLILQDGNVFLGSADRWLFGPKMGTGNGEDSEDAA